MTRPLLTPLLLAALAVPLWAGIGPAGAAEYRSVKGVQPGHVVWLHAQPDAASKRVGYLKAAATRVRTTECRRLAKGGWCRVMHRGTRGWVQDHFLEAGSVMRG